MIESNKNLCKVWLLSHSAEFKDHSVHSFTNVGLWLREPPGNWFLDINNDAWSQSEHEL